MQTINDLVDFMTENCYQKFTLTDHGNELQLSNGFGLKFIDEKFHIVYNERGNIESIKKIKTESEAVSDLYKRIKSDKLLRRHCIGVLKSKESYNELTQILRSNNIRFEQDSILYGENDNRYRVFVFGCDVKKIDGLKDLSKTNNNSWTNNKTLLEYTQYTPCKEIFQAVCDELGSHYLKKGFKYSRSRPKITIQNEKLKLDIGFSSSGSNTPGQSVNLQILPSFYSKQLKDSNLRGYLLGHTGLFYHKYQDDVKKIRVNKIFGEVIERIDEYSHESKIIDSNNCNVYGLQKENFDKILNFIDSKIIIWFDKLQTKNGILELIENASITRIWSISGQGTNSNFVSYVKYNYPEIEIDKLLAK